MQLSWIMKFGPFGAVYGHRPSSVLFFLRTATAYSTAVQNLSDPALMGNCNVLSSAARQIRGDVS